MKRQLNVLIACEESQTVCKEMRKLGHNAYSCDLIESSGGHPEWHFKGDCLEVIRKKGGVLETGEEYFLSENEKWDLLIAHPPCTYLTVSGNRWFYHPDDKDLPFEERRPHPLHPNRRQDREDAIKFFMDLYNCDIEYVAVENPIGTMSSVFRKPDQVIHPYHFGDSVSKATCLWLKNLKPLEYTNVVEREEFVTFKSGKRMGKFHYETGKISDLKLRAKARSKTFDGIAKAIATQFTEQVLSAM